MGVWFGEEDFLNSRIAAGREGAGEAIKIRESPKVESVAAMGHSPASATEEGQVICCRADAQSARDAGWKPALRRGAWDASD